MRKPALLFFAAAFTGLIGQVRAQGAEFHAWESAHYLVFSDESEAAAREIGGKLEAAFQLFAGYFHFDPGRLAGRLRARIYREKKDFDAYLRTIVDEDRSDFVLISYADPKKSELLGFRQEPASFDASLLHQGFIQYLKAFVPGAPVWLQVGMAACLEKSVYEPASNSFQPRPNFAWLPTLKRILRGEDPGSRLSVAELVTLDKQAAARRLESFYPQAWGLVHFLLHSDDRRYNRLLWDAIGALDPGAAPEVNASRIYTRAFSWVDEAQLRLDYESFILAQKTPSERLAEKLQEGVDLYGQGKLLEAQDRFRGALALQSDLYLPYYYLGLIHYARQEYAQAAEQYLKAQELGIEPGLGYYALGVNAFAEKEYTRAEFYLVKAREANAEAFGELADALLKRIELLK